jgi:CheY-like chemotaxis protein
MSVQVGLREAKRASSKVSILLVEDNLINQKVALLMLKRMGYRADVASNGIEALQALEKQHYDVIFMDVQMPEMDGLEATKAIRQRFSIDEQPTIVAITAYAMDRDKEKCLDAGMDGFISKPVEIGALKEVLMRQCNCEQKALVGCFEDVVDTDLE